VDYSIRPVTMDDIPFLWEMLYYAAHMSEDGVLSAEAAKDDAQVNMWVKDWGRGGDRGLVAVEAGSGRKLGAAWLRLQPKGFSTGYVNDETPELAIAVLPECTGQGIGSALLTALMDAVRAEVPAVVLTVREGNPARKLYERQGFVVIDEVTNRVGTRSSKMLLRFMSQRLDN
jgi:ribosomal protein S18 acetylase RimI-like enzyme